LKSTNGHLIEAKTSSHGKLCFSSLGVDSSGRLTQVHFAVLHGSHYVAFFRIIFVQAFIIIIIIGRLPLSSLASRFVSESPMLLSASTVTDPLFFIIPMG
jgi:hypothetical protein